MLLKTAWIADDPVELAEGRRGLQRTREKFRRHIHGGVEK